MNLRERLIGKVVIVLSVVALAIGTFVPSVSWALDCKEPASLNQQQLEQCKQQLAQQETEASIIRDQKKREADSLQGTLSNLDGDIAYAESQINNVETRISVVGRLIKGLSSDMVLAQAQLDDLQTKQDSAYVGLYELSQTGTADSILSSSSLSDVVSQSQYIQVLQTDLQANIKKAVELKTELDKKKTETELQKSELMDLERQLNSSRSSLGDQRAQKSFLLSRTQGEEQKYQELVRQFQQENAAIEAQIIARLSQLYNSGGFGSGPGVGQPVSKGTPVGIQGSTGFSTGDHVHFEVRVSNVAKNPRNYISGGVLAWPLKQFVVTQEFGENWWNGSGWAYRDGHTGIDIAGPTNSTVYAPADGTVIMNEWYGGYGRAWVMRTEDGLWVLLGHLKNS